MYRGKSLTKSHAFYIHMQTLAALPQAVRTLYAKRMNLSQMDFFSLIITWLTTNASVSVQQPFPRIQNRCKQVHDRRPPHPPISLFLP